MPPKRKSDPVERPARKPDAPFLEWTPIWDLSPWDLNPKDHPEEQVAELVRSIRLEGWTTVLRAHRATGRLIAGHGRRLALLDILDAEPGFTINGSPGPGIVPVVYYDGTWEQAQESAIRDNRVPELGTWDDSRLAQVVKAIRLEDESAAALASRLVLEDGRVRELLRIASGKPDPRKVKAPAVPELPTIPDSQVGTTYELGPHLLRCGDSTSGDELQALLGGRNLVDTVFTDPPFAIYGSSSGIGSDIADDKMIRAFFRDILVSCETAVKLYGQTYICCDWRSYASWWEVAKRTHLRPKNCLVWDKGNSGLGSQWGNAHEFVGFWTLLPESKAMKSAEGKGSEQRSVFSPNMLRPRDGEEPWVEDDGPARLDLEQLAGTDGLLRYNRVSGRARLHNAAKPVPMIARIFEESTPEGGLVLDLFGGSGSTLIAAAQTGRVARMLEIEPKWCDVIRKRWTAWAAEAGVDAGPGALR